MKVSWTRGDLLEIGKHERRGLFTLDREHVHLLAVGVSPVHLERRATAVLRNLGSAISINWEDILTCLPSGSAGEEGSPGSATRRQSHLRVLGAPYLSPKLSWNQPYTESILRWDYRSWNRTMEEVPEMVSAEHPGQSWGSKTFPRRTCSQKGEEGKHCARHLPQPHPNYRTTTWRLDE